MHNGAFLPLLIQPARAAKSPDNIVRLKSLSPRLQVERLRGDAAFPLLLKGVHSVLPVLQVLGSIFALHHVQNALHSLQAALQRVPSPNRKDPRDLPAVLMYCHILSSVQRWQAAVHPSCPQDCPSAYSGGTQDVAKKPTPLSARGSIGRPPSPPGLPPPWLVEKFDLTAKLEGNAAARSKYMPAQLTLRGI